MKILISQICGNCYFSLTAHRAQKCTDPKTLQRAIQPAGRLLCQPSEWALCKHLVPETDCVTRISTFTYPKPLQVSCSTEWLQPQHLSATHWVPQLK